ncbi:Uncharacterised protein [Candidatus Gugararchaeum adminiculabundum]|nr:Uncharacterised protein [Candidatus Gugararchaeum adminiculabundum]
MPSNSKTKLLFFSTLLCVPAFLLIAYLLPSTYEPTSLGFPVKYIAAALAFIVLLEFLYIYPFFENHTLLSQEGKVSMFATLGTSASLFGFILFLLSKSWILLLAFIGAHAIYSAFIYWRHLR